MKKKIVLFVLLLSVGIMTSMMIIPKPKGQIICFGDSITHGAKVDGNSWVYVLQQKNYPGVEFVNEGRSGRKTADKKELLPVLKKYPDAAYYLLFLGVNDLKNGNTSMVNSCIENMKWMMDKIHAENPKAKIVLLAPTDINIDIMTQLNKDKKYNWNTKKSLRILEKRYKMLAKKEHAGFISLLHVVSRANYADGLHPNVAGQREIAKAVWEGLKSIRN
ncbi:MAG TPA: SGNH/GDSL hydrolase family protein [Chitinophagaceae bacterium]|nr:SGNH/GDSL hydrolase family protein [Chitinophagaceae bacterium]